MNSNRWLFTVLIIVSALVCSLLFLASCNKDDDYNNDSDNGNVEDDEKNYVYKISGNNAVFTAYLGTEKNLVIPRQIVKEGVTYTVTAIAPYPYDSFKGFTSITIPDSVTDIDVRAFLPCRELENITVDSKNPIYHSEGNCLIETASKTLILGCKTSVIPTGESVTSIGDNAFYSCSHLSSITIPENVKAIGRFAFYDCSSLTDVTISDGVSAIGESAFSLCTGLEGITIPDSITSLGGRAFSGCTGLKSIVIPDGITSVGDGAFSDCTGLTDARISKRVTVIAPQCSRAARDFRVLPFPIILQVSARRRSRIAPHLQVFSYRTALR